MIDQVAIQKSFEDWAGLIRFSSHSEYNLAKTAFYAGANASRIPDDHAIVPLEPTHKMLTSGIFACADPIGCTLKNVDIAFMRAKYKAMIAAAQEDN